jgi:hypothetical protein
MALSNQRRHTNTRKNLVQILCCVHVIVCVYACEWVCSVVWTLGASVGAGADLGVGAGAAGAGLGASTLMERAAGAGAFPPAFVASLFTCLHACQLLFVFITWRRLNGLER